MDKLYKICILCYGKLADTALQTISTLSYDDTSVLLYNCNVETLPQSVERAISEGCEVFVAGFANAAEFRRHSRAHLVELQFRVVDYLLAIKRALRVGTRPVLALYRFGRPVDVTLLEELAGVQLETLTYEDSADLQERIQKCRGDVIVGASHAYSIAVELGKKSVLLSVSEDSIRSALNRARTMCIEHYQELKRNRAVQALVQNAPFGLILCDSSGHISMANDTARKHAGLGDAGLRGQLADELLPSVGLAEFLHSGERQSSNKRLINGAMMWCVQTRLEHKGNSLGVLITLYPDNSRPKKSGDTDMCVFKTHITWKDAIGDSPAMTAFIKQADETAGSAYPLVIHGEAGTGRNFFAQCVHNASARSKQPYVPLNASVIPDDEAARVLFGSEGPAGIRQGLLELAGAGTIVLKNLPQASQAVQHCLLQALTDGSFFRLGGKSPVIFKARVITILNDKDHSDGILPELRHNLSVLTLSVPSLREHREDIPALFHSFTRRELASAPRKLSSDAQKLLRFYSWPGNLLELTAVCRRYAWLLTRDTNLSPAALYLRIIEAIGENNLFSEITARHPALKDPAHAEPEAVQEGIELIKKILKYTNSEIAEKLSLSRTTLWRLKNKAQSIRL